MDISQAAELGTGKLGTGTPTKGASAPTKSKSEVVQGMVTDILGKYVVAGGAIGKIDTPGIIKSINQILADPAIGATFGIPPETKESDVNKIGGQRSNSGLPAAVSATPLGDASDVIGAGYKGLLNFMEGMGNEGPLVTNPDWIKSRRNTGKPQKSLR